MSFFYLPKPNAVMLHLPKAGGLSIRGKSKLGITGVWPSKKRVTIHLANEIPKTWPMDRCFSCHRHPLTHFLSGYRFCNKMWGKGGQRFTIDEVIDILCDDTISVVPKPKAAGAHVLFKHHMAPYTSIEFGIDQVKYWMRFERYHEDFEKMCKEFLDVPVPKLPKSNSAPGSRCWEDELTAQQIDRLVEVFSEDFEYFGYERP